MRLSLITKYELIGYNAQNRPLYKVEGVDDDGAFQTAYGDGSRWEPVRPEIARLPPGFPWVMKGRVGR